ncbi:2-hydroxychromene-2-carboxylate isomerase [Pacificispira sp.]|uniref:2-hydroxychromene-2-carboxylate isomerase n=1 Tax=Pacificispira sp. TaxID=2888761 RepID=UPI003B51D6F4
MTHTVDLYWSFRSPYSYLANDAIVAMRKKYDLTVNVRIVYPIAIRSPEFFEKANPLWRNYIRRDVVRVAEMKGIPFSIPPVPDPVVIDKDRPIVSPDQPYIYRLSHIGAAACESGDGLAFIHAVAETIWSGRVRNWDNGDHLERAANRAGFDLAELDNRIAGNFERYDQMVKANQDTLEASGHWGVPTLVYKNEPFFGQDRVDLCLWRMKTDGLKLRST